MNRWWRETGGPFLLIGVLLAGPAALLWVTANGGGR